MVFAIVILIAYFIPALVAQHRHKKNLSSIVVLNLLLGWTLIGWIVALVWATAKDDQPVPLQSVVAAKPDIVDRIEKLARLHKEGALTEEEFKSQKQAVLKS